MNEHFGGHCPDPLAFDFDALHEQAEQFDPASDQRLALLRMILGAAQELDQPAEMARAALEVAEEVRMHGKEEEASRMAGTARDRAHESGQHDVEAEAYSLLAELAQRRKDLQGAVKFYARAAECYRLVGNEQQAHNAQGRRARILDRAGEYDKALGILQELPPVARTGSVAMLEVRLLLKLERKSEAVGRAGDVYDELKERDRTGGWHFGCDFVFRDLSEFLAHAGEIARQRDLLLWRLSCLGPKSPSCLSAEGELCLALARNWRASGSGDTEGAERWLARAIPLLGEMERHGLFEAFVFAAEEKLAVPGRPDPWLAAFECVEAFLFDLRLERLGRVLGCTGDDETAARLALRVARTRYRKAGNLIRESDTWRLQARFEQFGASNSECPARKRALRDRALRSLSKAQGLARRAGDLMTEIKCAALRSQIQQERGESRAALRAAIRAHALAERLADDDLLLAASLQLARLRIDNGQRGDVAPLLNTAKLIVHEKFAHDLEKAYWRRMITEIEDQLLAVRKAT